MVSSAENATETKFGATMKSPGGETGLRTSRVPHLSLAVQSGNALAEALCHPANAAPELLRWLVGEVGGDLPPHLPAEKGVVCDVRPGHKEQNPSLSYATKPTGAVFRRFGDDNRGFSAVSYVAECLNIPDREAARLLIERAGLLDHAARAPGRASPKAKRSGARPMARNQERHTVPLTMEAIQNVLAGWNAASDGHPELTRRGLGAAVETGLLQAHTRGHDVAFEVRGPEGETLAIKRRCDTTTGQRYRYLTAGQGAPAWCSPQLLGADCEVWIEGELNGVAVAAALAGSKTGVQGMAGAGGRPHTDHLRERPRTVYIYADSDDAGRRARARWQELAEQHGCAAHQLPDDR